MIRAATPGLLLATIVLVSYPAGAGAVVVGGGGSSTTDCMAVLDAPGANHPAPPKIAKNVDCVDGDVTCDADGLRNGECSFSIQVCLNSTALASCGAGEVTTLVVDHAEDNGDPKFDPDFQALQTRVNSLGLPNDALNECTLTSTVRVPLRAPTSGNVYRKNKKKLGLGAEGDVAAKLDVRDKDRMKFTCRPEGDGIYLPVDLYNGTFDRIRQQVFAQSCALSACHDSESAAGGLILLPGAAYSQLVGVAPTNVAAAGAGLQRIFPGDPTLSFLYRKITDDLEIGWGGSMPASGSPVSQELTDIIELWILGDGLLGAAPETGWVTGTDQ